MKSPCKNVGCVVLFLGGLGAIPGFCQNSGADLTAIDRSASPCANFYQYACGTWIKNNPVPADQSRWTRFNELTVRNEEIERKILERAEKPSPARTPLEQQIGDYYAACMNETAIEKRGVDPLKPALDGINGIKTREQLMAAISQLHHEGIRVFFTLRAAPDEKDAAHYIANLSQGGLSLPDRDYYLKDDPKTVEIRKQFREHVKKMFELLDSGVGRTSDDAGAFADAVLGIETELAKVSLDRVALRNPDNTYHKTTVDQLLAMTPGFDWAGYGETNGIPHIEYLNVAEPDFLKGLVAILANTDIQRLKVYLAWHVLDSNLNVAGRAAVAASVMPKAFEDENWNFNSHILNGVKEQEPRWKRCVQGVDSSLGEALGQEFVKVAFSESSKERTLKMVGEIEKEMAKLIQSAEWMSPATKDQATTKLHEVANKIGYPSKWRDYRKVKVIPGDAFGNAERARIENIEYRLAKIGTTVDKAEWTMTPPTVNAYYSPSENNINFPAGILQPPFFNASAIDAVNYGGIGAVVGHELTHGFDDQGRRYDGRGNLRDWWTESDGKAFEARADCIVKEYGGFSPVPGVTLNGKLTLGENAADNGGIRLAFMAMMDSLAGHPLTKIDGFTPQQQFFLGYAQLWCGAGTPESAAVRAKTDPHSPGEFRVNGVLQNLPEFSSAFGCKTGDAMVSAKACRVW
jgi:endothelin-converting enzyme/putative endopeptidase